MKVLITLILILIHSCPIAFGQDKPAAAVAPLATLGDISEVRQRFIFNSFLSKLSQHYDLISQDQFKEAQNQAFDELTAEECTEENCIRKVQELLQIENLFVLQMLAEGNLIQLSLSLVDLDKKHGFLIKYKPVFFK